MKSLILLTAGTFILTACDPYRDTRPIQVVATPELVQRQSCEAIEDAHRHAQDETVLTGVAEHGHPDTLRISCDGRERQLVFMLVPPPDDLGMKELRRQWQKKTGAHSDDCHSCPKYNVSAKFVGTLRADPADPDRLLYLVRTADRIQRKRIHYGKN